jgi:hypothetical protein
MRLHLWRGLRERPNPLDEPELWINSLPLRSSAVTSVTTVVAWSTFAAWMTASAAWAAAARVSRSSSVPTTASIPCAFQELSLLLGLLLRPDQSRDRVACGRVSLRGGLPANLSVSLGNSVGVERPRLLHAAHIEHQESRKRSLPQGTAT